MDEITQDTHIDRILANYPSLSKTFIEFGLPCLVCGEPFWGTVKELGNQHRVDVTKLVKQLNKKIGETNAKT